MMRSILADFHNQKNKDMRLVKMSVRLRDIERDDLFTLYEYQLDPDSNQLAATHPRGRDLFDAHWASALADPNVVAKAILVDDTLAGCISRFKLGKVDSVSYWIGKEFWGKGVATKALKLLLKEVSLRPLHARVAASNVPSIRVLQKCGFTMVGYEHTAGDDRLLECEEAVLRLK